MSERTVIIPGLLFDRWQYLDSHSKVLLMVLYSLAQDGLPPTPERIEERSGLTKKEVRAGLNELTQRAWVKITRAFGSSVASYEIGIPIIRRDMIQD